MDESTSGITICFQPSLSCNNHTIINLTGFLLLVAGGTLRLFPGTSTVSRGKNVVAKRPGDRPGGELGAVGGGASGDDGVLAEKLVGEDETVEVGQALGVINPGT